MPLLTTSIVTKLILINMKHLLFPFLTFLPVLIISMIIHFSIYYFNSKDNRVVIDKLDKVNDIYVVGYEDGYHQATEDLAELNTKQN